MPLYFAILATVVISVLSFAVLSVGAFFVVIPAVVLLVGYLLVSRRSDGPRAGTIERVPHEPTGVVRKARGGPETANERVGQP